LIEGMPGAGKTTLALQFLRAGAAAGETVLYVTLSETEGELRATAAAHGWDLQGLRIRELTPPESTLSPDEQNTIFHPSELELAETMRRIVADVEELRPKRLVLDSLSELRMLAGNALRYRRQILALKHIFARRSVTVLLLDDVSLADQHDLQMQSIAHGVVLLEQTHPHYGAERRRVRVVKYRGVRFRGGYHDYLIRTGGLEVYPRLVASEHRRSNKRAKLASEIAALDSLIGGGVEEGTSTLLVGAPGTGKSTLAAQFAAAAARRGERSALFVFDESPRTLLSRCTDLGVQLEQYVEKGIANLRQVDPAELTPGELSHAIKKAVDDGAKLVVIDSLNGYLHAMPEERFLAIQLHELLAYLGQQGVATILIGAHKGLIGTQMTTPIDASYLADAVIMLRYFEARGEVRQAISVVKKRGSQHERTIREFKLDGDGIRVGAALTQFRGVLTGVPVFEGDTGPLLTNRESPDEERRP
jgi:circadian clock protein KaiC